ncbi:MAG: ArsC family transcriptional regulator, partial [Oscillospiraceae bacterium]|nr:ArsC family transcriptional regulator [Oscillospiraceae bacterium]
YGSSIVELNSVRSAVGLEEMITTSDRADTTIQYLAADAAKLDKLFDEPWLLATPIVRNGRQATVGYCPETWSEWE